MSDGNAAAELSALFSGLLSRPLRYRAELEEWWEAAESVKCVLARVRARIPASARNKLWHYLFDAEARYKDPEYAAVQNALLRELIGDLERLEQEHDSTAARNEYIQDSAIRMLGRLPRFRRLDTATVPPQFSFPFTEYDDPPLGLYENTCGSTEGAVLLTCNALVVMGGSGNVRIAFADIREAKWRPQTKKEEAGVEVRLRDGGIAYIPITGRRREGPDAYFVAKFLRRIYPFPLAYAQLQR